ncbi:MAG: hypothetical protein CVU46_16615 [Chloroflexi bacterium HGW-Chloroflexi-8]|nr:MAG: hypothetical protein CVU46_16615 [Chloroflexi bacterium HGW-Chloroflexi-8]
MKTMVVLVNNEYNNDPRVNRCVTASKEYFDQITVLSGVPHKKNRTNTRDGSVTVKRYYYYKPNFSKSKFIKKALDIASKTDKTKTEGATGESNTNGNGVIRILLHLGWFFYIFLMNLWIFIRFAGLRADIYYANDYDTLLAAFLLAKIHHGKLIYDSHVFYSDLLSDSPKIYRKLIQFVEGHLARKASVVITVNHPIANILTKRYQLIETPVVIYNTPYFQEVLETSNRIPNKPFKLLYHGMYLPGRDLDELVRSMKDVTNFRLYLRGFGIIEQVLRDLVLELGLSDRVIFLEPVAMKEMVFSAIDFDMGIIPYPGTQKELNSYYCTPNKIFEYMMAGLALAVSDLPVLREIVSIHKLGVIFDSNNPRHMAEVLNKITQENMVQMKINSLLAAKEIYNFNQESKKLHEIYDHLYQAN